MKLVVALIRPECKVAVLESINELDACVVSLGQVSDGGTPVVSGTYRGASVWSHVPRLRLEVAVNDAFLDDIVEAIAFAAGGGVSAQPGTCRILVMPLEELLQIPNVEQAQQSVTSEDFRRDGRRGIYDVMP